MGYCMDPARPDSTLRKHWTLPEALAWAAERPEAWAAVEALLNGYARREARRGGRGGPAQARGAATSG